MIDREKVHSLVGVFYQPEFKTFFINSEDGKTFKSPLGVFVSLGMTTSFKVLSNICEVIDNSKEYSAKIVEISSGKVEGQFINTVTNDTDPKQYQLGEVPGIKLFDREEAETELERLKKLLDPKSSLETIRDIAPRVSKLQYFIDKLNESNGWDAHRIQVGDDYRIYHLFVNYRKENNLEYRLGIYVTEKQCNT